LIAWTTVAGGEQGLHPRAAFGLDADDHLIRVRVRPGVGGQQGVEPVDPGDAFLEAGGDQSPAGVVLDLDVVMVLGPVISYEQHPCSPVVDSDYLRQQRGSPCDLMNQCSRQVAGHDIPDDQVPTSLSHDTPPNRADIVGVQALTDSQYGRSAGAHRCPALPDPVPRRVVPASRADVVHWAGGVDLAYTGGAANLGWCYQDPLNEGDHMENDDLERVHALETAQATQAATLVGAQATQTAAHTGTWAVMAAGSVSLIVGIFLGMAIAKS